MRYMTWRAMGLADIARHVIRCHLAQEMRAVGCHLTEEARVQNALDDVAGNIC